MASYRSIKHVDYELHKPSPAMAQQPIACQCFLVIGAHYTQKHYTWYESSARVISPRLRPIPNNTQHAQETNIPSPRRHLPRQSQQVSSCRPTP